MDMKKKYGELLYQHHILMEDWGYVLPEALSRRRLDGHFPVSGFYPPSWNIVNLGPTTMNQASFGEGSFGRGSLS